MQTPIPNRKLRTGSEGRKQILQTYGPDLLDILKDVCNVYNQPIESVLSDCRKHEFVVCRMVYSYACSVMTDAPTKFIAATINRERTNVSHHRRLVKDMDSINDPAFVKEMDEYFTKSKLWVQYNKTS